MRGLKILLKWKMELKKLVFFLGSTPYKISKKSNIKEYDLI